MRLSGDDKMRKEHGYNACLPVELGEAKKGGRRMMVHMQEG
jgi:hypothetical protein